MNGVRRMKFVDIRKWNEFVQDRFKYTPDDPIRDTWNSHAKKLLADPKYKIYDDCDGLACTVAEILHINGASKVWRIMCSMQGGKTIDHMVAMVEDTSGQRWIVGDTANKLPVKLQEYDGRIFKFNKISDGIEWTSHP